MSYAEPKDNSARLTGLSVVVVLHLLLVYALVTGLAREIVQVIQAPLETKIIEEVKPPPPDKPPPPPPPKLAAPPPPFIPPPEIRLDTPPPPTNTITATTSTKPVAEAPIPRPAAAPAGPARTSAVVDAKACAKPEYPPQSLRAQEEGLVVLQFLIGADGQVKDSRVDRSSGFRRLDQAAQRALSLCKFKAGTENGQSVESWARIEYQWRIEE